MTTFSKCPRCGSHTYELLRSHSHCVECLYFVVTYYDWESEYYRTLTDEMISDLKWANKNDLGEQSPLKRAS